MQLDLPAMIGTEGLGYQGYSAFADEIIALCQSVIDEREKLTGKTDKIARVAEFAMQRFNKDLPAIVERHCGFRLQQIVYSHSPTLQFAIMPLIGNHIATLVAMLRAEGDPNFAKLRRHRQGKKILTYAEYESVSRAISDQTGQFDRKQLEPTLRKLPIGGTLYFDLYSAFLGKELIHVDLAYFTAEEIAAIIMHEIGHVFDTLRAAGWQFRRNELLEDINVNFLSNGLVRDRLRLIKQEAEHQNQLVAQASAEAVTETLNQEDAPLPQGELPPALHGLMMALGGVTVLFGIAPIAKFFQLVIGLPWETTGSPLRLWPGKLSDVPPNLQFFQQSEKSADQFTGQHGLSPAMVSGLERLSRYASQMGNASQSATPISRRSSRLAWWCGYGGYVLIHGVFFSSDRMRMHPRDLIRFEAIRRNLVRNLIESDQMPPEMQDLLLADLAKIDRELKQLSKTTRVQAVLDRCQEFISRNLTVTAILRRIFGSQSQIEYTRLIDAIDQLIANPLLERAAQLRALARKSK